MEERKRMSGVFNVRKSNKGKEYRTAVRPTLMYGAETWALKKAQEKKAESVANATVDMQSYKARQGK